jgi:hypothetical protein
MFSAGLVLAEEESLSPNVIDELVCAEIRTLFEGNELVEALSLLPSKGARVVNYRRRKVAKNPEMQAQKKKRAVKDPKVLFC